jgi:hypothetical protein
MRHRLIWLVMAVAAGVPAFGGTISVNLGSAISFGFLGGTISNTGGPAPVSNVIGDVGGTVGITGFPPGTATGTIFLGSNAPGTIVGMAYTDFLNAFSAADSLTALPGSFTTATSQTFLGNTVYASSSDISTATGTNLTFDAGGDPNAVFVIQVNGAFTVNGVMTFTLDGNAQADNIFWLVKSNATISVGSSPAIVFDGNILAGDTFSMSAKTGGSGVLAGTINGCVFAENANTLGGVTDIGGCAGTTAAGGGGGSGVPEPGSSELVSLGCLLGVVAWRKLRVSL